MPLVLNSISEVRMNFKPLTLIRRGLQLFALIIGLSITLQASAADPFVIRDIRVEGLQRVEPGTVFASISLRVGDEYTDEKGAAVIRSLFALGLFKDVRIELNGKEVVLIVEERPIIAAVDFIGTK
ncbi:MAG: putative outer membrane protein insertion machinery protein Omp85, partial [Pseudomonadota bacterium]